LAAKLNKNEDSILIAVRDMEIKFLKHSEKTVSPRTENSYIVLFEFRQ
jgi:hypothetical protein